MSGRHAPLRDAVARKGSFGRTLRAVAWSFFGVRRSSDHEEDLARLNPLHVLVVGVAAAALFVLLLMLLVHWIVGNGAAG